MTITEGLLVCTACSTQYDTSDRAVLKSCRTCDDPRQFVPRNGQSFTTLGELRNSKKYSNEISKLDEIDDRFWSIRTEPPFGIGQRAFFIKTPFGNVLWDCIAYFDEDTIKWIRQMGGLDAVVISHPHYYSTVCNLFVCRNSFYRALIELAASMLSGRRPLTAPYIWHMKTRFG
jgi:hypothetical protein